MMTGKQLWDELDRLEQAKHELLEKAAPDDLRRALSYGLDRPTNAAAHRVLLRRAMRRRGIEVPERLA